MTSTLPPLVQAFSGAIGSATANALTYPLDLLTTRLQLEPPESRKPRGGLYGASMIFRHIADKYGWHAFYDGLTADTYATLLSNFFYFYFYAFLRLLSTKRLIPFISRSKRSGVHKPSMIEELLLGYVAGIASRLVATPLNIVTLKLQTERENNTDDNRSNSETRKTGMNAVVKRIYQEQGLAGFWRGFQMSALLALNPSITLAFFQMFGRLLTLAKSSRSRSIRAEKLSLKQAPVNANLSPWESFFGAAIANSIDMRFSAAFSFALPVLAAATAIDLSARQTGNCDTGSTLCCNSAQESNSTSVSELAGLLGIVLPDIAGLIGLGCSPLSILGFGGNSCSAQPVCCTSNTFSGLIALGCNPINLNL
ncbi:hypothetical protein CVT26_013206 [Gymnopilus dilepis]|uniref:Hydrophobin n=1 Tax=Gymnopilus dilepis TaxID=231916 RepID=A0A409VWI2_9AGAR|nr:hypothetical protein CVT26_013206 [Gymnopilus dilepis]